MGRKRRNPDEWLRPGSDVVFVGAGLVDSVLDWLADRGYCVVSSRRVGLDWHVVVVGPLVIDDQRALSRFVKRRGGRLLGVVAVHVA